MQCPAGLAKHRHDRHNRNAYRPCVYSPLFSWPFWHVLVSTREKETGRRDRHDRHRASVVAAAPLPIGDSAGLCHTFANASRVRAEQAFPPLCPCAFQ